MPTVGPNSPGTLANDASIGTLAWSTIANAGASDNAYAVVPLTSIGAVSNYAKATNFPSFGIPGGSVIESLTAAAELKGSVAGGQLHSLYLVKGGVIGSTNLAALDSIGTADAYLSKTGLGGFDWTTDDLGSDCGFVIAVTCTAIVSISLDHMRLSVTFVDPSGRRRTMTGVGF